MCYNIVTSDLVRRLVIALVCVLGVDIGNIECNSKPGRYKYAVFKMKTIVKVDIRETFRGGGLLLG